MPEVPQPSPDTSTELQISVVVCTYNRSDLLAQVLETLCAQAVDPTTYEVIVVDNNSKDDTAAVTAKFAAQYPNVRYCFEASPGASFARNRGWQEARGQYVAYTDDDCKCPPQWLAIAQEIIATRAPTVFGGPYFAFYNVEKPTWFKDAYGSSVETPVARNLTLSEHLAEGNMFVDRRVFAQFGGFRTDLGPSGNAIGFGEGTDWLIRGRKQAPDTVVYYDPRLFVYHLVRPEKFKWGRILRRMFADGRITYRVFDKHKKPTYGMSYLFLKAAGHATYLVGDTLYGLLIRDRGQYPLIQNYLYEHSLQYLRALGTDFEEFQTRRRATGSQVAQ